MHRLDREVTIAQHRTLKPIHALVKRVEPTLHCQDSIQNVGRDLILPTSPRLAAWEGGSGRDGENKKTHCFGTASRYLHSIFFSLQLLHGFSSSHFALSCRHKSQAYSIRG